MTLFLQLRKDSVGGLSLIAIYELRARREYAVRRKGRRGDECLGQLPQTSVAVKLRILALVRRHQLLQRS